nr:hypothetical protein [Armatimonas sp.]
MLNRVLALAAVLTLSCSGVWSQATPPGGEGGGSGSGGGSSSGGGSTLPFGGNFIAIQVYGYGDNLFDRILAENIHGDYQIPAQFNGSAPVGMPNPPKITVPHATYDIGLQFLTRYSHETPNAPVGIPIGPFHPLYSGQGATGYWNGTDPGWTVLPDPMNPGGTLQAGGYFLNPVQIEVNLANYYAVGTQQPYRYEYKCIWRYITQVPVGDNSGVTNSTINTSIYEGVTSLSRNRY